MAFFRLVLYASKLNRITEKLKAEKEAAAAISRKEKPKYGWRLKLSHVYINCKRRLRNCFINLYFLKNTAFDRFLYRLRKYGSLENYILKSLLGFVGGYVLTYLLFLFLAVQLNVKLSVATLICCFLGCILTIGLAFSQTIRCIVFLTLPQFFSKRGRQALIAYALILTMTGPAKNTLNNMGIMSESLACGQEQLKSAVKQILDVIKKPFVAIKEALKAVVKAVKEVIKKIKEILIKIKRVIMAIIGVIKSVFQFLGRILNLCNKELGTPYQRCSRVFETAITDCQASLGPFFSWTCSIGYLLDTVCYIVKPFDLICMLVDFISDSIIGVVIRKIKIFIRHVKTMFYVRIKFSHSYHFESKSSKSMREIANSIVGEVKMRTKGIVSVFEFFNCAASLFFIFLISRVIYYRHQFLTKERFDNKFLTKNLVDIDLRRAAMEKETIFPLNHRERKKYITIKSVRLLSKERKQLSEGLGLLMSTVIKVGTHMAIDYSLFWIMNLIRKYGKFQSKVQPPNIPTTHISGQGLLADLLKAVVKSFQPLGISLEIDTVPCLPIPIPPDFDRYVQIASILVLCLLLTILEPYGLRWRNWILCYYYPKRARERAVWLYNHILRSRSSFLKFARRQLRRKVLGSKRITKVTCLEYLRSKTNNKCLLLFLGSDKQQACLLCGEVFRKSDKETPIRCQRPGCTAVYCKQCFEDLENICTVCLSPIEYGDFSDFSEERDSSDEEYTKSSKPDEEFDSGMNTDEATGDEEESTDEYSFGYQESEKLPLIPTDYRTENSRDLEKQSHPDYVSMQYFEDEIELYTFKPFGFEDKDEETQFPEESYSSDRRISNDPNETSSVASSFEKDKDHLFSKRSLESQSCLCLDPDIMDETFSEVILDESKPKLFTLDQEDGITGGTASEMVEHLLPVQEQSEDEALIQFSSDEKEEEEVFDGSSRSQMTSPKIRKVFLLPETQKDVVLSKRSPEGKLISDSEYSENDVQKLIGKHESNIHFDSTSEDTSGDVQYSIPPNGRKTSKKLSTTTENEESSKRTSQSSRKDETISISLPEERHIEFIGLENRKGRAKFSTDLSLRNDRTSPLKTYQSTISTKTSKQDFPTHKKQRKSILRADSGSSILSEIKELHEKVTVPKLDLKSLNKGSKSRTTSSPSNELKDKKKVGYDALSGTTRRASSSRQTTKFRKTNKTEKRLEGGANIPIFSVNTEKFRRDSSASSCWSSENLENLSTDHLLHSEFPSSISSTSVFSSLPKFDLTHFQSSDTSVSPLNLGERSNSPSSSIIHDSNKEDLKNIGDHSVSMSTDISTAQPSINDNHSVVKSSISTNTKKSVRISETLEETEDTSDSEVETDASSDLSISVQENILGIPKSGRKKEKIDWTHEREIRSELPAESEALEKKSEEIEYSERQSKEEIDTETDKNFDKTSSKENSAGHDPGTIEHAENTDSDHIEKTEKFLMEYDDPRFFETRSGRKCQCCKCKDKLPITHHTIGGVPDRKILLHTGVDSCTQTCIDCTDQSSQIEFGCKSTRDNFARMSSNKYSSVRCKLKDEGVVSSFASKPEKHCVCNICCQLKSLEVNRSQQKVSFCDNPCLQIEANDSCAQKKCIISPRKTVGTFCKPQTRDQVSYTKKPYGKNQEIYRCQKFKDNLSSRKESNESISSNNGSYRDRFDLPYQDNEEYKRLVRELEEKLVARNRERVRKTMREFEKCSARNQNLTKPILYDDSSCGEEPILNKLVHLKSGDAGDKGRLQTSLPWKRSIVKGVNTIQTMPREIAPRPHRLLPKCPEYCYDRDPTHWQMDTSTGEWYRVSDVDICDPYDVYEPESRYYQPIHLSRRRMMMERYDEEPECEDCDDLNRRYGHMNKMLFCSRHKLNRFPPRHRKR